MPEFRFPFGAAGGGGAVPERLRPGPRGVNPKAPQTPRADLHVSLEADVERDREKESKRPKSRESPVALRGNYKNVTPWAGIPATALPCRARPSASSRRLRAQRPLSMGPARSELAA